MMRRPGLLALCSLLATMPAAAHEVQADITSRQATVVTLRYADGQPFAFEAFEVFDSGNGEAGKGDKPLAVGRTDSQGQAVFTPPSSGKVRLRAFSADGHGIDRQLTVPPAMPADTRAATDTAAASDDGRVARILFGLGLLLATFGLIQLRQRKGKRS